MSHLLLLNIYQEIVIFSVNLHLGTYIKDKNWSSFNTDSMFVGLVVTVESAIKHAGSFFFVVIVVCFFTVLKHKKYHNIVSNLENMLT